VRPGPPARALLPLLALVLGACGSGDTKLAGLWSGAVRLEPGERPTRARIDGAATCLLLRHGGSDLVIALEGTAARNEPLQVQVLGEAVPGTARFEATLPVQVSRGSFRARLKVAAVDLGPASFVTLAFSQPGVSIEGLALEEGRRDPKLLVLALDGASWRIMRKLLDGGRLPHIQSLIDAGVSGPMQSIKPTLSPIVWTSIASGKGMTEHGIRDFLDEAQLPVNASEVKSKRIWNIISEKSRLTVGVLGWFVTWPVERISGFMVSDRAIQAQMSEDDRRLSFYPGDLQGPFEQTLRARRASAIAECKRFTTLPLDPEFETHLDPRSSLYRHHKALAGRLFPVYLRDSTYVETGLRFYRALAPDVFFVYLRGPDWTQHAYWFHRAPEESLAAMDPDDIRYLKDVIDSYYVYLDEVVGRFMAAAPEDAAIGLVSDHGFRSYVKGSGDERRAVAYHELEGIYVFRGPGFKRGTSHDKISVMDMTPLWLYHLGLPVAKDMPGRVPLALRSGFPWPRAPELVASYGDRDQRAESKATGGDSETLEQLKALGYIGN
jgi:hypothetical protein